MTSPCMISCAGPSKRRGSASKWPPTGGPEWNWRSELKPAVITLDVMMPHMDGWSVLNALKANPATADIPVIMLTMLDDKQMGFSLGATDYLTKPLDFERLLQLLKKYGPPVGSRTVLVIEDDTDMREVLRRTLSADTWQVTVARNGKEGLAKLSGSTPALILLDLMMPEMDGFEFLEALRLRPGCEEVPVIVVTAKDLTEEDRLRLNGGVARIVEKGRMSMESLVGQIRSVTGKEAGAGI